MSLGGIGSPGGEGSRGQVGTTTYLADDQPDVTKYHATARGTVIPHRQSDGGASPGFDAQAGLEQFKVCDINTTAGSAETAEPFTEPLESLGLHFQKERPCPPTSPPSETSISPSSPTEVTGSPSVPPTPPEKTGKRRSPTSSALQQELQQQNAALLRQVSELSAQFEKLKQTLLTQGPSSSQPHQSLTDRLDLLTSAVELLATSKTASATSPLPTDGWTVEMSGAFGHFSSKALAADFRSGDTLLLLFDPRQPHFIPARSDDLIELVLRQEDRQMVFSGRATGWSSPLMLGGQDYLLVIMGLVE